MATHDVELVATTATRVLIIADGELVADGATLQGALDVLGETAEGATTIEAARDLAARLGVEMPITDGLHRVLYEGQPPLRAMQELMSREPRSERTAYSG